MVGPATYGHFMTARRYSRNFLTALTIYAAYAAVQDMLSFALPLLAFELRGDGLGLSLIKGAAFIPNILFAVFVGVINDRIRKATGFRFYSGLLAFGCLVLLASLTQGLVSVPGLMVFMVIFNAVGYALGNAQLTLIRLTVPHERLSHATSLSSAVHSVITTIGPAVGGFALLQLGYVGLVAAVSLVMVCAFVASFWVQPDEEVSYGNGFWASLSEGWQVFAANRELMMMTVVIVLTNAAAGAFDVALILKLKTDVLANAFEIGIVLAFAGMGAVVASAFAPMLRQHLGYRAAFFWPIWVLAGLCALTAFVDSFALLCVISFCEGGTALFFAIGVWSYRQESVEAAHMGRVAGITGAIFKIGMPPVIILAGVISDTHSVALVLGMAAAINVAAALFLVWVAGWGWPRPARPYA